MQENEQEQVLETYCWSYLAQDYVLVYRGTDEKEEKRARRSFLCRETRARNKRRKKISEIVQEEKLYSYEDALDYLNNLVNGGKVAAVLLEYMELDRGHWEMEITRAKKEREERENGVGNDAASISRLMDELERLEERFCDVPEAIEALEAVKFWGIEESVLDA